MILLLKYNVQFIKLTLLPSIWLIAADSLSVHSATICGRISFIYNMKAFNGFFMWLFFGGLFSPRPAPRPGLTNEVTGFTAPVVVPPPRNIDPSSEPCILPPLPTREELE